MFACEYYGVEPDVMTVAKALGCGLPVGAFLCKGRAAALEAGDAELLAVQDGARPLTTPELIDEVIALAARCGAAAPAVAVKDTIKAVSAGTWWSGLWTAPRCGPFRRPRCSRRIC